jgi:hypothetical protein
MLMPFLTVLLLPNFAHGVDITFFEGKGCSGHRLFGDTIHDSLACYNISRHGPTTSASIEEFKAGQKAFFYSDTQCRNEVYSTEDDVCYAHSRTTVKAVRVQAPKNASTTDLDLYEMPWSGDTSVEPVSRLAISEALLGVVVDWTSKGVSLGTFVAGCWSAISEVSPLSIVLCGLGGLASVLAVVGEYLKRRAGARLRGNVSMVMGQVNDAKKRNIGETEYNPVLDIRDATAATASHVGFMEHDIGTGNQTSSVFEFQGKDGETYHTTSFYNHDADIFVHRMYPARHAVHDKRDEIGEGFLGVRWDQGGLDFAMCNYNENANVAYFNDKSEEELYEKIYQDLECLMTGVEIADGGAFYFEMYVTGPPY